MCLRVFIKSAVQVRSTGSGLWSLVKGIPCGDVKQVAGNAELKLRDGYVDFIRCYCRGNY